MEQKYHEAKISILRELADLFEEFGEGYEMQTDAYYMGVKVTLRRNNLTRHFGGIYSHSFDIDIQSAGDRLNLRFNFMKALRIVGYKVS